MLKVILSRLESVHENLRTDEVEGQTHSLPKIGKSFSLTGKSLTEGYTTRAVITTEVTKIRLHPEEGSLEFWTANSHYGLQILNMDTEDIPN